MVSEEQQSNMELAAEIVPVPQIQNSTEDPTSIKIDQIDLLKRKPRLRKKALHAAILKQMEFYFGDANLNRDRFLGNLIKEDPHINISVFLQFNKIRALTNDTSRIAKALRTSSLLSVSEDGTKVWRVTPISQKENSDECTIYVQKLPTDTDHDWLSSVFSQYGSVIYVSIPRYKNRKIKGFAFVEFETVESAKRCIEAFREKGCVLPSQTSPDKLMSITTYEKEDPTVEVEMEKESTLEESDRIEGSKCEMEVEAEEPNENAVQSTELSKSEKRKKRRCTTPDKSTEQDSEELTKGKRRKLREFECTEDHDQKDVRTDCKLDREMKKTKKQKSKNRMQSSNLEESDVAHSQTGNEEKLQKQNHKELEAYDGKEKEEEQETADLDKDEKRKKQKQNSSEVTKDDEDYSSMQSAERSIIGLEVEKNKKSKKRKLINIYTLEESSAESGVKNEQNLEIKDEPEDLDITEEKMIADKLNKRKRRRKRQDRSDNTDVLDIRMQVMSKNDWKKLRNKYLELQRSKMKLLKQHLRRAGWSHDKVNKAEKRNIEEKDGESEKNSIPKFTLTPGAIVKIKLDEPCMDSKSFKMKLKGNTNIKYIDVSEGSTEAFVRCDTAETANALVQNSIEGRHMTVLQGEEEKVYHERILSNREEKLNKKVRVKQRGRDKLLKKAEKELGKHIKFDEV